MRLKIAALLLIAFVLQACASMPDYSSFGESGEFGIETKLGTWTNPNRNDREVPWKLFLPVESSAPAPVILVSPGGGGARDDPLNYLGEHLASFGFAVFQLQHRGSDRKAFTEAPNPAVLMQRIRDSEPRNALLRQEDIQFAVDQIENMSQTELADKLDTSRMGIAGFSFGAITTLISAGMDLPQIGQSLAEPRFKAAMALSPSARYGIAEPVLSEGDARRAYRDMLMPILHMRGTEDITPLTGITEGVQRELPFRVIDSVDQYLVVLIGAEHPTFGGANVRFPRNPELRSSFTYPALERHRELIRMAAAVYWSAFLKEDKSALRWFVGSGFAQELGQNGTFESKPTLP